VAVLGLFVTAVRNTKLPSENIQENEMIGFFKKGDILISSAYCKLLGS
jgi:hypothetical protein